MLVGHLVNMISSVRRFRLSYFLIICGVISQEIGSSNPSNPWLTSKISYINTTEYLPSSLSPPCEESTHEEDPLIEKGSAKRFASLTRVG